MVDYDPRHYGSQPLEGFRAEIDKVIIGPKGSSMSDYFYSPSIITDYLVGIWGFDRPKIEKIDYKKRKIFFVYHSVTNIRISLEMYFTTHFRKGLRLTNVGL
jgi:hypothetical protein